MTRVGKLNQIIHMSLLTLLTLALASCDSAGMNNPGEPTIKPLLRQLHQDVGSNQKIADNAAGSTLPAAITDALIPQPTLLTPAKETQTQHFDISANEVPAREFFMSLVKGTPYNIVISPKIQGTITLHLSNVTIPQVLTAIKDIYGYQYHSEPYGYQVYPMQLETRIFTVSYLDATRSGGSYIAVESGLISQQQSQSTTSQGQTTNSTQDVRTPSTSLKTQSKVDFWQGLQASIQAILSNVTDAKVVITPASGMVVVTATPAQLQQVSKYLDSLDHVMTRQVIIEAEIVNVQLNNSFQAGINWSLLGAKQTTNTTLSPDLSPFTPIFSLDMGMNNITNLLATQGNVQVLSSPRIATLNNQKAVIKVGDDEYFVTKISNTVSDTSGGNAQVTQDINMEPFFSGISLAVTPTITADENVMLEIHPIVSTVSDARKEVTIDEKKTTLPSAKSAIDESDSVVYAHSGQVIILGGLIQNNTEEHLGSTPFLGDIPFVGTLFRRTNQVSTRDELVILLKPVVVDDKQWVGQLQHTHAQLKDLDKGFHFGAFPQQFGNQGEMQGVQNLPFSPPSATSTSTDTI